jgi:beta-mannosidase
MTMGPWRPISLHTYKARVTDLRVQTDVSETLDTTISVSVVVSYPTGTASISLKDQHGTIVHNVHLPVRNGEVLTQFKGAKGEFDLWYPVGYGKQPIYTLEVTIYDEVSGLCVRSIFSVDFS